MGCGGLDPGRKRRDRGAIEDVLEREVDIEAFAQARAHLRHRERVRAERKDVLIDADLRQLQQIGPDPRELRSPARCAADVRLRRRCSAVAISSASALRLTLPLAPFGSVGHAADQARHLVGRKPFARELPKLVRSCLGIRPQHHDGGDVLAELLVRDGEHAGLQHRRMAQQDLFDLQRRDLLPAAVDDVLDAADDEEIAVGVEIAEVAGPEPAVAEGGLVSPPRHYNSRGSCSVPRSMISPCSPLASARPVSSMIAISGPAARPTDPTLRSSNGLAAICEAASVMP